VTVETIGKYLSKYLAVLVKVSFSHFYMRKMKKFSTFSCIILLKLLEGESY